MGSWREGREEGGLGVTSLGVGRLGREVGSGGVLGCVLGGWVVGWGVGWLDVGFDVGWLGGWVLGFRLGMWFLL